MTDSDVDRARGELNVRSVIDLRGPDGSSGAIGLPPAHRVAIDFSAGARSSAVSRPETDEHELVFPWLLRAASTQVVEAVAAIAVADGSTVFHCHTGKDRTGLLAAVVLGLLGVSDEDILADYLLSVSHFQPMLEFLGDRGRPVPPGAPRMAQEPPSAAGMRAALDYLHACGGARQYLLDSGASAATLDRLTESLLE